MSPEIKSGIELGKTKAIKVDANYLTNDKDIYAIGDAIEVYGNLFNDYFKLALAGPAQKQARAIAYHINGRTVDNRGFIDSSVIKVFGYNGDPSEKTTCYNKSTISKNRFQNTSLR